MWFTTAVITDHRNLITCRLLKEFFSNLYKNHYKKEICTSELFGVIKRKRDELELVIWTRLKYSHTI